MYTLGCLRFRHNFGAHDFLLVPYPCYLPPLNHLHRIGLMSLSGVFSQFHTQVLPMFKHSHLRGGFNCASLEAHLFGAYLELTGLLGFSVVFSCKSFGVSHGITVAFHTGLVSLYLRTFSGLLIPLHCFLCACRCLFPGWREIISVML